MFWFLLVENEMSKRVIFIYKDVIRELNFWCVLIFDYKFKYCYVLLNLVLNGFYVCILNFLFIFDIKVLVICFFGLLLFCFY